MTPEVKRVEVRKSGRGRFADVGSNIVNVRLQSGEVTELGATDVVFAAGPWTGKLAKKLLGRKAGAAGDIVSRQVSSQKYFVTLLLTSTTSNLSTSIVLSPPSSHRFSPHALFCTLVLPNGQIAQPEFYPRPDNTLYVCGAGLTDKTPLPLSCADIKYNSEGEERLKERVRQVVKDEWIEGAFDRSDFIVQACYRPDSSKTGAPIIGKLRAFLAAGPLFMTPEKLFCRPCYSYLSRTSHSAIGTHPTPRIARHFHAFRGGQNLSARFSHMPCPSQTEESSIDVGVSKLSDQGLANESTKAAASRLVRGGQEYTSFHGVKVPKKPTPPTADECWQVLVSVIRVCTLITLVPKSMSGCAVCVYDIYMDAKKSFRISLISALAKLESLPQSQAWQEHEWPDGLRKLREQRRKTKERTKMSSMVGGGSEKLTVPLIDDLEDAQETAIDASMKAFAALERSLKHKG
ncbi:uncharacterized protein EI90DRAFT_3123217 [Cantharellus anzutake]|uniref:uncharacterized protein n=1 Tax=Cantharellus anzutake TaxID=1750568 RepID=UPI001903CA00|nr:uncharacterized protein EI90DRAFT_3123217 [Cantharellus anzutake]KAF8331634.1 hypothetical protein EI90DRAFT_3123217 [Cantharellus anzutake]